MSDSPEEPARLPSQQKVKLEPILDESGQEAAIKTEPGSVKLEPSCCTCNGREVKWEQGGDTLLQIHPGCTCETVKAEQQEGGRVTSKPGDVAAERSSVGESGRETELREQRAPSPSTPDSSSLLQDQPVGAVPGPV